MVTAEDGEVHPVPADQLPVILPEDVVMDGVTSPIKADKSWAETTLAANLLYVETDTFDTFVVFLVLRSLLFTTSWRYLNPEKANYWRTCESVHPVVSSTLVCTFCTLVSSTNCYVMQVTWRLTNHSSPTTTMSERQVLADAFYHENEKGTKSGLLLLMLLWRRDGKGRITSTKDNLKAVTLLTQAWSRCLSRKTTVSTHKRW